MAAQNAAFGVRSTSELMKKHWKYLPSRSPVAASVTHPCYLTFSIRSRQTKRLAVSPGMGLMTPANATMQLQPGMPMLSFHRARTPNCGSPTRPEPEHETKRSGPRIKLSGSRIVAASHWIPPPKPRRNNDALCETAWPAPLCARLRSAGR